MRVRRRGAPAHLRHHRHDSKHRPARVSRIIAPDVYAEKVFDLLVAVRRLGRRADERVSRESLAVGKVQDAHQVRVRTQRTPLPRAKRLEGLSADRGVRVSQPSRPRGDDEMIRNATAPTVSQIRRRGGVERVYVLPGGVHEVRGEILERVHERGELAPGRFVEHPNARLLRDAQPVSDGGERGAAERALVGRDAARQNAHQNFTSFRFFIRGPIARGFRVRNRVRSERIAYRSRRAEKQLARRVQAEHVEKVRLEGLEVVGCSLRVVF